MTNKEGEAIWTLGPKNYKTHPVNIYFPAYAFKVNHEVTDKLQLTKK